MIVLEIINHIVSVDMEKNVPLMLTDVMSNFSIKTDKTRYSSIDVEEVGYCAQSIAFSVIVLR